jgi:alkylation response protein AidB-like acyl-CoA dehydrogenase
VHLGLTEEQRQLRSAFHDFFGREAGPQVARAAEPLGFDPKLWSKLAETGAPAMATGAGGSASLADMCLLAEEAGRTIAPVPLAEHLVASGLMPDSQQAELAAFAPAPACAGVARAVPGGAICHAVVALDDAELVAVELDSPPPLIPNLAALPLADVDLRGRPRTVLAVGDDAVRSFRRAQAQWQILTAGMLVGAARAALGLALGYVMQRTQFGVPIGAFQALQQPLADLPGQIDGADLLVAKAAWAVDARPEAVIDIAHNEIDDPSVLALMAYIFASQVAREATRRSLQCHGGYGYSAEYDIQLFYRRVRGWSVLGGSKPSLQRELAERLGMAD